MGPLTANAKQVLVDIVVFVGEPGGSFDADELIESMHSGDRRGIKGHTLPALQRRGYVRKLGWSRWTLAESGFEEAMRITGGKGLL